MRKGFTWASELMTPDAVYCLGVFGKETHSAMMRIKRLPKPWTEAIFSPIEWLPKQSVDPALVDLVPSEPRAMTPKEVSMCQKWFGPDGQFPIVHIETGELRDV